MKADQDARLPAFMVLSRDDIAARAYEIYLERGAADGYDREDWLRAEQELKSSGRDADRRGAADGSRRLSRRPSRPARH